MIPAISSCRISSPDAPVRWFAFPILLLTLVLAGPVVAEVGREPPPAVASPAVPTRDRAALNQRVFDRVWSEVRHRYYDPTIHGLDWNEARRLYRPQALAATDDRRLYLVLDRMLDLLDDDHAGAAPPAMARRQDAQHQRRPIMGVTLYPEDDGRYRVDRVRPGSPAEEAGIEVGWRLDGTDDSGWTPDRDVVAGEAIVLRLTDRDGQPRDVTVVPREMDPLPTFVADRSHPDVLILRIESFEAGLGRWMGAQLAGLPSDTEIVLDLRDNPGGLLMEADAVLSCFLPERMPWATRTNRSGRPSVLRVQAACGDLESPAPNPLAVLVDGSSRSAAELTPAALQEAGRAIVVGEKTAGAVLISQDTVLPDGGRLTLSRADFVTAGGVRLEKRGVDPDLWIAGMAGPSGIDDQALSAAITALRNQVVDAGARPDIN